MSWLFGDGFDFYSSGPNAFLPGTIWNFGPQMGLAAGRFGTGNSCNLQPASAIEITTFPFTNSKTIWINFAFTTNLAGMPNPGSTHTEIGFRLQDGINVNQMGFYIRLNGTCVVTNGPRPEGGGTVIATSPVFPTLATNVWTHFQVKVVIDAASGSVEVRLNGNTTADWLATGLNTQRGTGAAQCNICTMAGWDFGDLIDDCYGFNDLGSAPNNWQGDVRAIQLMPNADIAANWIPLSGVQNFAMVNELKFNGDTNYVFTNTPTTADLYDCQDLTVIPASIVCVQPKMAVRMDDSGPHQAQFQLQSGPTNDLSQVASLSSNYTWIWKPYPLDPNTGAPWTFAAVNAAQVGPIDVL